MGGLIGSGLTAPDLRETSLVSLPIRFAPFPHKYITSLTPLPFTLPTFAFAALEPLLGTESAGEKKREGRERERARLTIIVAFSTALMAGAIVIQADPWGRSDVSMEML